MENKFFTYNKKKYLLRVIMKENNYFFNYSDLCDILSHSNPSQFSRNMGVKKYHFQTFTNGGKQKMIFCDEVSLLTLINGTRKKGDQFKKELLTYLKKENLIKIEFGVTSSLESNFFYRLEKILKEINSEISFIREFTIGKYRVDLFIPDYGIIVEYYEKRHEYSKEMDSDRIEGIREKILSDYLIDENDKELLGNKLLSVDFIIVKEGEEDKGTGNIIKNLIYQGLEPLF